MKAQIDQYVHTVREALDEVIESAVMCIHRDAVPVHNESEMIRHKAEFAADNPSVVGLALLAYLSRASAFAHRMYQFYA